MANVSYDNETFSDELSGSGGLTTFAKVTVSLQLTMMVAVLFGNILVIIATLKFSSLWNVTGVFVCNLAVADVFMGLVLPFQVVFFFQPEMEKNKYLCLLRFLLVSFSCKASIYSLACTVVDRYLAIVHPFKYLHIMTFKTAYILVATVWFVDIAVTIIPLAGLNDWDIVNVCLFQLIMNDSLRLFNNITTMSFSGFMAILYLRIYAVVRRHARQIAAVDAQHGVDDALKRARQTNTVIALVVIFFHASWLPYFCLQLTMYNKSSVTLEKVTASSYLVFLGIINSVVNPLIYAWKNKLYRRAFKRILCLQLETDIDFSTQQSV